MSDDDDDEQQQNDTTEYTFGSAMTDDFNELMSNDGEENDNNDDDEEEEEEGEEDEEEDQGSTASELELLKKIFSGPATDEEVLFLLSDRSGCGLPQLALKKRYIADDRFDLLRGVLTLMQRLLHLDDDVLSHWMGGGDEEDGDEEEGGKPCIIAFLFQIVDCYFERIVNVELVEDLSDDILLYDSPSSSLSLYDLIASVCCAFVLGLNEEHLNIAEEVLFEALLSDSFLPAALASDVLVFIARAPGTATSFTLDITVVIFSLLNALYVEDERLLKSTDCSSSSSLSSSAASSTQHQHRHRLKSSTLLSLTMPQEVLTQLLYRLFRYLQRAELKTLKEIFPLERHMHLWKHLPERAVTGEELCRVDMLQPHCSQNAALKAGLGGCGDHYDKLFALTTRDTLKNSPILPSLASAYVATSAVDEYRLLLNLRLLVRSLQYHHHRTSFLEEDEEDEEEYEVPNSQKHLITPTPSSYPLNSTQVMAILSRARTSLLTRTPSANVSLSSLEEGREDDVIRPRSVLYRRETVLHIIRLLDICLASPPPPKNCSSSTASDLLRYQSPQFTELLQQLLLLLHRHVEDSFLSEQLYLALLLNLSRRRLFEEVVVAVVRASPRKIRVSFTLLLKHLKNGYFMKTEERELYTANLTKVYFELVDSEEDSAAATANELMNSEQVLAALLLPRWTPSASPKMKRTKKKATRAGSQISKRSKSSDVDGEESSSSKRLRPSTSASSLEKMAGSRSCTSPSSNKLHPLFKHIKAAIDMAAKIRGSGSSSSTNNTNFSSSASQPISRSSENDLADLIDRLKKEVGSLAVIEEPTEKSAP